MKISILGDPQINWFSTPIPANDTSPFTWEQKPGFSEHAREGGCIQVGNFIAQLKGMDVQINGLKRNDLIPFDPDQCVQWKCELSKEASGYAIKRNLGYIGPTGKLPHALTHRISTTDADVIAIYDGGNGFSESNATDFELETPQQVICFSQNPNFEGKLWAKLDAHDPGNFVFVTNLDSIRLLNAKVSKGLSWEKTFLDFVQDLSCNPDLLPLKSLEHLIVRIGLEGAIYWNGKLAEASLIYDAESIEGERSAKSSHYQILQDEAFFGCLVASLSDKPESHSSTSSIVDSLKKSVQFLNNYDCALYDAVGHSQYELSSVLLERLTTPQFHAVTVDIPTEEAELEAWNVDLTKAKSNESIESLARKIVLQNHQAADTGIPTAQFNFLKTLDREEAEGFRSIQSLITEYLAKPSPERPLSFAVFGFPGSGKSFGVKQIAKKLGSKIFTFLESNVSQFTGERDIIILFNKVRDVVLSGKVPLVFFDEFDSKRGDQVLGWLKSFLAPMQDGEYNDGEDTHPIGRSVFVFAGGTANTFQQFSDRPDDQMEAFRRAKGPDFVSRLRGFVNIRSFNPENHQKGYLTSPGDHPILLRRALILRSVFERSYPSLLDSNKSLCIDECLLDGLLNIGKYKNGVRSLEALLDMSSISGKSFFGKSDLPSKDQLELVVNPEDFYAIIDRKTKLSAKVVRIAKSIHAQYILDQEAKGSEKKESHVPWNALNPTYKNASIDQARHILYKLSLIDCDFRPNADWNFKEFTYSDDEIEQLAEIEHQRWMDERTRDGWIYGKIRDDLNKIHPDLVDWSILPESIRDYDRDAIRTIPSAMAKAGFEIYRK